MRIGPPGCLRADDVAEQIGGHAAKLVILAIEIGLVHREGIDQMLDLVVGVGAQQRKIAWNDDEPVAAMRSARRRSM